MSVDAVMPPSAHLSRKLTQEIHQSLKSRFGMYSSELVLKDSPDGFIFSIKTASGDFVLQIPHKKERENSLRWQSRVIDTIVKELSPSVMVPSITLLQLSDRVISIQEKICGEHLTTDTYSILTTSEKDKLAGHVTDFIALLHSSTPQLLNTELIHARPKVEGSLPFTRDEKGRKFVFGKDIVTLQRQLEGEGLFPDSHIFLDCVNFCDKAVNAADDKVCGHFDLHGYNLFVSPGRGRINGIIDFENFQFFDRNLEFSRFPLIATDFLDRIETNYTGRGLPFDRAKVDAYYGLLLGHLLGLNIEAHDRKGIENIQRLFAKYEWGRVK